MRKLESRGATLPDRIAALLFPTKCICCGKVTDMCVYLCDECRKRLSDCRTKRTKIVSYYGTKYAIHAPFYYTSAASSAVKRLKFAFAPDNAKPMGEMCAQKASKLRDTDFDIVAAVPMTPCAVRERGYNQSLLIAKSAAAALGVPLDAHALKKIRENKRQHTLTGLERRENVRGVYAADKSVSGKHVLLIDDVTTTGATLCECAECLLSAGAMKVTCIAFCAAKYSN